MRTSFQRTALLLCAISLVDAGCALRAKDVKPAKPYDFVLLDKMARYAQAAYADDMTIQAICRPEFDSVYIKTILSTNNKYFIATSSATHTQLIAIAGTANLENVLLDTDLNRQYVPELKISLHQGFARAARAIYDDAKPHLVAGDHIEVTGHSLGGAEALIIGMLLKSGGTPASFIITFGQPKVSNQAGVDAFADLPLTRVVNQNDIVPELPLAPFSHIGPVLVLFSQDAYSVVSARAIDPKEILLAWQALQKHQPPAELPEHYIASYLTNLDSKLNGARDVPYPK